MNDYEVMVRMQVMCEESLSPVQFEEWEKVKDALVLARSDGHASDCAIHNMPAYPNGPCNCGAQ